MNDKPAVRKGLGKGRRAQWPWPEFQGRKILVTGGSQGIGHATARAFADSGAEVTITGTRPSAADYADDLGGLSYRQADFALSGTAERLADALGPIDVLVNNAGAGRHDEYADEGFRAVIDINLNSLMGMCLAFHAHLKARQGAIVNMGSLASFLALKDQPAYTASKSAVHGLTRALADKWARDGIRVNMVAPGFIHTRMTEIQRTDPAYEEKLLKSIPMRRWGEAAEVAQAVLFLASPRAPYITGQYIRIDGGLMLR